MICVLRVGHLLFVFTCVQTPFITFKAEKSTRERAFFNDVCPPFGRDVDLVSDVRFAREESGTHHITLLLVAIHHYADRYNITVA